MVATGGREVVELVDVGVVLVDVDESEVVEEEEEVEDSERVDDWSPGPGVVVGRVGGESVGAEDCALSWTEKKRKRREENKMDLSTLISVWKRKTTSRRSCIRSFCFSRWLCPSF